MNFPPTIETKLLDIEHPDLALYKDAWNNLALLVKGGAELKKNAAQFLSKRPKEPTEVYNERLKMFAAQNIIGATVAWYMLAMFKADPKVYYKDAAGKAIEGGVSDWYDEFRNDCDRAGTTYDNFFRDAFEQTLIFGRFYILEDLPADAYDPTNPPASLGAQKDSGALNPYVIGYDPRKAQNYAKDAYGNLEWILFKTTTEVQTFAASPKTVDRWYYYDREQCAVYEAERKDSPNQEEPLARLVSGPKPHSMADKKRVPVRVYEVPDGLWLGDRAYLDVMAHLNMRNGYFWGLFMACLPTLWVKGKFLEDPQVSEIGWIQVPQNGDIGYLEVTGAAFERMSLELAKLIQEIYRQMYLQAQGKDSSATASSQSGYSKEMDMAPAMDVLNGLGEVLRAMMQLVLGDIADIRGDEIQPDVNGFEFDDVDEAKEFTTIQICKDLRIQSKTLEKELDKRAAGLALRGRNPELLKTVEDEIDTNPTASEVDAQMLAQANQQIGGAVQKSVAQFEGAQAKP